MSRQARDSLLFPPLETRAAHEHDLLTDASTVFTTAILYCSSTASSVVLVGLIHSRTNAMLYSLFCYRVSKCNDQFV